MSESIVALLLAMALLIGYVVGRHQRRSRSPSSDAIEEWLGSFEP